MGTTRAQSQLLLILWLRRQSDLQRKPFEKAAHPWRLATSATHSVRTGARLISTSVTCAP